MSCFFFFFPLFLYIRMNCVFLCVCFRCAALHFIYFYWVFPFHKWLQSHYYHNNVIAYFSFGSIWFFFLLHFSFYPSFPYYTSVDFCLFCCCQCLLYLWCQHLSDRVKTILFRFCLCFVEPNRNLCLWKLFTSFRLLCREFASFSLIFCVCFYVFVCVSDLFSFCLSSIYLLAWKSVFVCLFYTKYYYYAHFDSHIHIHTLFYIKIWVWVCCLSVC